MLGCPSLIDFRIEREGTPKRYVKMELSPPHNIRATKKEMVLTLSRVYSIMDLDTSTIINTFPLLIAELEKEGLVRIEKGAVKLTPMGELVIHSL